MSEKIILMEIRSLDNDFGCIATNKKLGEVLDLKPNTVSLLIKSLDDKGVITITYKDYQTFDGRNIKINYDSCSDFFTPPIKSKGVTEKSKDPHEKSIHSNTISSNNSNIKEDELKNSSAELDFNLPINKKNKKEKPAPNPLFVACKDHWLTDVHPTWTFGPVQGASLKLLLSQLRTLLLQTRENCSDDDIVQLFKAMCAGLPEFYKSKDMQVINSKFNEIVTELKERKNARPKHTKGESIFRS